MCTSADTILLIKVLLLSSEIWVVCFSLIMDHIKPIESDFLNYLWEPRLMRRQRCIFKKTQWFGKQTSGSTYMEHLQKRKTVAELYLTYNDDTI